MPRINLTGEIELTLAVVLVGNAKHISGNRDS